MSKSFDENSRVKIPALVHLTRLGYKYISVKNVESQIDEQTNIYRKSFRDALNRINETVLADKDVDSVIGDLKRLLDAEDLGRNFYEKFSTGIAFEEKLIRLIDFDNLDNNIFEVMTELPYRSGSDSFRPDITIFINGLPLAFVEVKIPDNKQGMQAERQRMAERFSQEKYRRFVNITQLMIFSNNSEYDDSELVPLCGAFYAASDYRKLFFNRFREESVAIYDRIAPLDEVAETKILRDNNCLSIRSTPEYETNKNPLTPTNKILTSLLSRDRFLFILRYGFAYVETLQTGGFSTIQKHIMRYQQIFAELAIKKMLDNKIKRGVIWHTQGSGKTALAFHSVRFLTDYYQKQDCSTQFYFIVDRLELLQQATNEFRKRGLKINEIDSREKFIDALQRVDNSTTGKLSITVLNIQKFSDESVAVTPKFNVNVQRIYFIDEAHRDYKWDGSFLARLMKSDRNAVMIALTGTPLIGEYKTRDIFGNYIHKYYYNQSIADGYTLRLIREGIKTEYRLKLQAALIKLQQQVVRGSLDKKKIYSHENYIAPLVEYIEQDFEQSRLRLNDSTIGAMVVCESSEQAKAVHAELSKHGKFSAELVLSTENFTDEELDTKRTNFKLGNVDILVVFRMLLTGFDSPRLKKLYLGRKIKEHNLLQALTRVNRPYKNLRYGYVVDFADIREEFDKTNQAYLQELQQDLGDDFRSYQKIFKTQEEITADLNFVNDTLFEYDTDNAENFRLQIQAVADKKTLLGVRRAIELYRECYNLAEQYGYEDLQAKFNFGKISSLAKVVNGRIQLLNLKDALNNTDDMSALLNLAIDDMEFNFKKISEQELSIADAFINVRRDTCTEFELNADKKDLQYLALLEELRRILSQHNIEEMTAAQMQTSQSQLDALHKKIQDLNATNERLTSKYFGDTKFMRIHKRLAVRTDFPSPTALHELLSAVKIQIDTKLAANYSILDNAAYFKRNVQRDLLLKNFPAAVIKIAAELIAQEYIDERNATS